MNNNMNQMQYMNVKMNKMQNQNFKICQNLMNNMMGQNGIMYQQMPINQQMMMQNQIMLNSNNNCSNSQSQGEKICVKFKENFGKNETPIIIHGRSDEKLSSFIEKYRYKTDTNKYIYNAKNLKRTLTAAEAGILNDSTILVY